MFVHNDPVEVNDVTLKNLNMVDTIGVFSSNSVPMASANKSIISPQATKNEMYLYAQNVKTTDML